ncbi:MAG: DUF2892 domain-containing protein [Thiocapsa sp.]|jgi:membrane protein implicated in regulation of membrane protease activity|nr:DUF2892 domain-containing protein [Thiocapsa sp.]MCG6897003.1 DUF2892 domain-containing protein [Thiocapsa sp.]MCG6983808.1 DUF2892 domain-containing protein [Thiocapsa sp.]
MNLTKNVGKTDRNIRLAAGGLLVLAGILTGQWILTILGLIVLVTGATGTCPAYMPFNINTNKGDQA